MLCLPWDDFGVRHDLLVRLVPEFGGFEWVSGGLGFGDQLVDVRVVIATEIVDPRVPEGGVEEARRIRAPVVGPRTNQEIQPVEVVEVPRSRAAPWRNPPS